MTLTDYYQQLFGKVAIQDGNVIDMAEHGRVGGLSTGQGVKYVQVLDQSGDVVDSFGGSGSGNSLATLSVLQAGVWAIASLPTLVAHQGGNWTVQPGNTPNTTAWLVTMASISGKFTGWGGSLSAFQGGNWNVSAIGGSLTAYQGSAPWLMTMATQSVISYQDGTWNVFASLASGTSVIAGARYMPTLISLSDQQYKELKFDLFNNLMVNTNVPLPNSTKLNRFYTLASMASLMAAPGSGKRLVIKELDFSANATVAVELYEDHAGTPARVWGPHYFLPYAGVTKNQTYIPLTSNKSLGLNVTGTGNMGFDARVETENV